jgi:hypothetical protein
MTILKRVSARADAVGTFRCVSVWLMETVARWTPSTPEMEAKVMFGRHIWDYAQIADALGKRTFELRRHEHFTLRPNADYDAVLKEAGVARSTADRVSSLYEGILPGLILRYQDYVAGTDKILDEPTVVIIERIVRELERQRHEAAALTAELNLESRSGPLLAEREQTVRNMVAESVAG